MDEFASQQEDTSKITAPSDNIAGDAQLRRSSEVIQARKTVFSSKQLAGLRKEFGDNHYINEARRKILANELGLNETQIKNWEEI